MDEMMLQRLEKMEHDTYLARMRAEDVAANVDYVAMMADIEIPTEEAEENAQSEI